MAGERQTTTLGALADAGVLSVQTGPFGSQLHSHEYVTDGVPVIPTEAIGRRRLKTGTTPKVETKTADRLSRHRIRAGDILFARRGAQATGLSAIADERHDGWICGTGALRLRIAKPNEIQPQFLSWVLSSNEAINWLKAHAVGAVMPNLNEEVIRGLPLVVPPLVEQKRIAHILGTLEDKIELNLRMNATLEAMARALFQSWFVDFDPVRAKAAGQTPTGMDPATATFFPSEFEDSDMGAIPKGWEVGTLGRLMRSERKRVKQREAVVLSAVASGELVKSDEHFRKQVYSQSIADYLLVEQWDFAYNPSRINIGSIGMLEEPVQGAVSPIYQVLRPASNYRWFLQFLIRSDQAKTWITSLCSGSVRQTLSITDFLSIPLVIPGRSCIEVFNRLWTTIKASVDANRSQSRTLSALRDTLLPKLLSGELPVASCEIGASA